MQRRHALGWVSLACLPNLGWARELSMSGSLGSGKALIVIDGKLRTMAVGSSIDGVRLLSTDSTSAVVEVAGQRRNLLLGGNPVNLGQGGADQTAGGRIVLTAGLGGHFTTVGAINGSAVRFLVDTGATVVAMGRATADSIGLKYRNGQPARAATANGIVEAFSVILGSVRVADVTVRNVAAMVVPAPMTEVLLGNSFLSRFQMSRVNDVMTLERRI